jgi:hypothetical protein
MGKGQVGRKKKNMWWLASTFCIVEIKIAFWPISHFPKGLGRVKGRRERERMRERERESVCVCVCGAIKNWQYLRSHDTQ